MTTLLQLVYCSEKCHVGLVGPPTLYYSTHNNKWNYQRHEHKDLMKQAPLQNSIYICKKYTIGRSLRADFKYKVYVLIIIINYTYTIELCDIFCSRKYYTSHKINAPQNEVPLSYNRVHRLYFLTVIFAATIRCSPY